jgi:hypothetical protein
MLGFAPALLQHMKVVAEQNYAGIKITPSGFFKALIENNPALRVVGAGGESIDPLKLSTKAGHIRDVKLKYLPRITDSQIGTEDNCDNDQIFQYNEMDLAAPSFRKFSFFLDWRFVERYQEEASKLVTTGNPSTSVLQELVDQIQHAVNGLVVSMDKALLAQTVFGTNVTTGNNLAKSININKDGSVLDLSQGLIEILSDAQENEFNGELILVGNGLFNKFEIAKAGGALNGTGNAMNLAALSGYKWYNDINSATAINYGANAVAAFAKGTVGYVDIDRYVAWKTGKFGSSWFTQIMLPITSGDGVQTMTNFNLQIIEKDCPSEMYDGYNQSSVDRGYQVIISKRFGLFQQPSNSYQAGDRLVNNNGSLLYNIANDCDPCEGGALK